MVEPTAPTSEASESVPAASEAAPAPPSPMYDAPVSVKDLLEAGVHFGHQTRRWNPRMKPFLFGERNGVHIIDLDQTLPRFQRALDFVSETVAGGGKVLFVSTKRQAQEAVAEQAERAGQFYVNRRWLGGMLTNFKTVKKSIERFKEMLELVGDEEKSKELSKKELSRINRQIEKYQKSLDGIKEMSRLPDLVFVIDVERESIAVTEADRLGLPIVAVVDSNCDPDLVDYVVPGNDDSLRAIQLYCTRVADACIQGAVVYEERVRAEVSEAAKVRPQEAERPGRGRVVVEIKQQPRRPRGAHSAGGRKDGERAEREAESRPEGESAETGAPSDTPPSGTPSGE